MRALHFLLATALAQAAIAQAPVEERRTRTDAFTDAQQRAEFTRRAQEQDEMRLKQAEQTAREADAELEAAQKQHEQAKSQSEKAKKDLAQARARAVESRKAHGKASAEFERVRRGAPERGGKGQALAPAGSG